MSKKILHITSWYPTDENPAEALWIQRHIQTLEPYFDQDILHLKFEKGPFSYKKKHSDNLTLLRIAFPLNSYRLREFLAFFILLFKLIWGNKTYNLINFHIAYPNLVYLAPLRRYFKPKWVITEHWSAYHYHFHSKKQLQRIKNIFNYKIPLITVSNQLLNDIEKFSNTKQNLNCVIPNAVNVDIFKYNNQTEEDYYIMASFWKSPKNPIPVFEACKSLIKKGISLKIKVIGYGPLTAEMNAAIISLNLTQQIDLLGFKDSNEIALYMNKAKAFIMPSDYETFSAITAEALCCGLPVIASNSGALRELINNQNGILVTDNNWLNGIIEFENHAPYNRHEIARIATEKFSYTSVGKKYAEFLNS